MLLYDLLVVNQYSTQDGQSKQEHSSDIPKLVSTPPKETKKIFGQHNDFITAISVGQVYDIYTSMCQLSPRCCNPITLVITHKKLTASTNLRTFDTLDSISMIFKSQGSMSGDNKRSSCGVEAVFNVGFIHVTSNDFNKCAAPGIDINDFFIHSSNDDFLDNSGGGNNIPVNQMFLTLQDLSGFTLEDNFHSFVNKIHTTDFWNGRQWAVVLIPACGGHWISIEKILFNGQEALCLREGRGTTMFDYVNFPNDGHPRSLLQSGKRKR
jgi:hypothetical protein